MSKLTFGKSFEAAGGRCARIGLPRGMIQARVSEEEL